MNNSYALIFILGFTITHFPMFVSGQADEVKLVDSSSMKAVQYATISSGSFVCYSDQRGIFSTKLLPGDTFRISHIGYETFTIPKSELTSPIFLFPATYAIEEFEVSGIADSFEEGYHAMKTDAFSKMKSNFQAVLIQSPGRSCLIEKVLVHTRKNRKGTEFVVGLFSVTDQGLPGELIFSKEYKSPTGKNLLEIPIEEVTLEIPAGGIFVAIKNNNGSGNQDNGLLRITKELDQCVSYFYDVNQWFKNDFEELDFKLTYKIGLELTPF